MTKIQVNSQGKAYLTTAGKALAGVQPTLVTKPITENGTYNASSDNADGYSSVTVNVSGGGGSSKYGCTIDNLLGDVNGSGVLLKPSSPSEDIVFTGVSDITSYGLAYKFYNNWNINRSVSFPDLTSLSGVSSLEYAFGSSSTVNKMQIVSVSFPNLSSVSGTYAMKYSFANNSFNSVSFPELVTISGSNAMVYSFTDCSNLTSISFPKLTTLSGASAMYYAFYGCKNLTSVSFPELATITSATALGNTFQAPATGTTNLTTVSFPKLETIYQTYTDISVFTGCFNNQKSLLSISFPALKTTSFSTKTKQFDGMFNSNSGATSGAITIHFPSNLETTIQGLTGYPNFGATAGRLTLAFDLPATS